MGRIILIAVAMLSLFAAEASAQSRRVALGNAAYESAAPLANPVNEAADLAEKLRAVGFEVNRADPRPA